MLTDPRRAASRRFASLPRAPGAFTNDRVLGVQAGFGGRPGCRFSRNGCVRLILVPAIFSAPDFLRAKFDAGVISRGTCGGSSAVTVRWLWLTYTRVGRGCIAHISRGGSDD